MKHIDIDIITNYFCNFNCEYCFLHHMKSIKQTIDTVKLCNQLDMISSKYTIGNINIYGGEVSLLPLGYLKEIIEVCNRYAKVNVITNFTNNECNEFLDGQHVTISTSINEERSCNQEVENSLLYTDITNLSVIQVVTPSLLSKQPKEVLEHLELFKKDVSFLPYSPAKMAKVNYDISNNDFSIFMKGIISEYLSGDYSFRISNINQLNDVIQGKYNPRMQSILFINPFNEYTGICYDDGFEYFKTFDKFEEWEVACQHEATEYYKKCKQCEYYGHCYAEHIKEWKGTDECCGMKSLVKWYEENIHKDNGGLSIKM